MNFGRLILRNVQFHARSHLGTFLGATIGSAILIGALAVGDSVRESLRQMALLRLGRIETALASGDRFFREQLADDFTASLQTPAASVLQISGSATTEDSSARANRVQVLGVDDNFWKLSTKGSGLKIENDSVALNSHLAAHLKAKAGDTVLLRVHKPSLLSREVPISPQEDFSMALRLKVTAVISDEDLGRFGLQANQAPPFNAFVDLHFLQTKVGLAGKANLLLAAHAARTPTDVLIAEWQLADGDLQLRELPGTVVELSSPRIFLDEPVVRAAEKADAHSMPILTYFVNELRHGTNTTPYSMVTAASAPIAPADMRDDEILINQWLAEDLQAKAGDEVLLRYFVLSESKRLEEKTNAFRVRTILPLEGIHADRTLMPEFPGIAKAEKTENWDAGFPIDMKQIRPKDEAYWHDFRGTPKAFVTITSGKQMWANRFGELTAVRFQSSTRTEIESVLKKHLNPASLGLSFQPVREQALAAVSGSQDFGGLFLGFSFFLIAAALILMGLLFQFSMEQRATETGTFLALGFRPKQVRRILLAEGTVIAMAGGILGTFGGLLYARAMLHGLATIWREAVGTSALTFFATPMTLGIGIFSSVIISTLTIYFVLRGQTKRSARELLTGANVEFSTVKQPRRRIVRAASNSPSSPHEERVGRGLRRGVAQFSGSNAPPLPSPLLHPMEEREEFRSLRQPWRIAEWLTLFSAVSAVGLLAWAIGTNRTSDAGSFFGAGSLLLIAGIGVVAVLLKRLAISEAVKQMSLTGMGVRGATRRRKRSLATVALLASGSFLISAISAFHLEGERESGKRSSGTGGFAVIGETTFPVVQNLNEKAGHEFFGLDEKDLADVSFVAFRVHAGDDASCLNLNRAQQPRILGVRPDLLKERFTFSKMEKKGDVTEAWQFLESDLNEDEIPAIGDAASIQWALHKKVGDTIDYTDERGNTFKLRLVGSVANSILQGSLIIDEAEFLKRFPSESGYRMFLIDAPSKKAGTISETLSRALRDVGLELTPTSERLAQFNAVQNTYLGTFQILGGLGLLLGSAGLGVVVLRNVLERRGELALLLAVGFRKRALRWLVLSEHGGLLLAGLLVGIVAAMAAVFPSLVSATATLPFRSLSLMLLLILASGLLWTWLATRIALRGELLKALRNE